VQDTACEMLDNTPTFCEAAQRRPEETTSPELCGARSAQS